MRKQTLQEILKFTKRRYCTNISKTIHDIGINFKKGDSALEIKTITDNDVIKFAELTGDYNTIHTNKNKRIVHGAFLNGLVSGLLGTKLPGPGVIVLEQKFRFPHFCYTGETVQVKVQILSARKIIECEYSCTTNEGKCVLQGYAKLIMKKIDI